MHVLRVELLQKRHVLRLVLGADGAQADRLAVPLHRLFQLSRVGSNRKVGGTRRQLGAEFDARIQRHCPFKVDDQRVDVQLGNLGDFCQQLRHRDQHAIQSCFVHRGRVPKAGQQLGHPRARHQRFGQRHIQGRQRDGAVGHHLHRRTALAKQDDRAKHAVNRAAHNQFLRLLSFHHALHREPLNPRLGPLAQHPRQHGRRGSAYIGLVLQVQSHTTHV